MLADLFLDWCIPLSLVVTLAILIRYRQRMVDVDEHGYHFITSGLGFFALAVVLRLYRRGGMLEGMPFISDPMFYKLLFWSANTAGAALVVSGIATHVPVFRSATRINTRKLVGLELIRTIERLVTVEPRIDALLASTLVHIASAYRCESAALYRRVRESIYLQRATGAEAEFESELPGLVQSALVPNAVSRSVDLESLSYLTVGNRVHVEAVFALQTTDGLSTEDRLNLAVVAEILARRVALENQVERFDQQTRLGRLREAIGAAVRTSDSFPRAFGSLMSLARDFYGLDLVSTCLIDLNSSRMTRFTIGATGAVLTEKGLPAPSAVHVQRDGIEREPIVALVADPTSLGLPPQMQSVARIWYRHSNHRALMLVLASAQGHAFSQEILAEMAFLRGEIADILRELGRKREEERRRRESGRLLAILRNYQVQPNLEQGCTSLARLLQRALGVDIVRVSGIDQSPSFLTTLGLSARPGIDETVPANGTFLRSLLKEHELVLTSGKTRILNATRSASAMSKGEVEAMLVSPPGAVLIAPIRVSDGTLGTISVASGGSRARSGYSRAERHLIHLVAQVAAIMIGVDARSRALSGWSIVRPTDQQLRSRLKSSLSGIMGSLELIRMTDSSEQNIDHYLKIIDKSAQRINDYLTTGSTVLVASEPGVEDDAHR